MTDRLGFGLIGASTISREWMIDAIRASGVAHPVAVFSRDRTRGERFASETGIAKVYDSLAAMLADPTIGAVYIASTNERHHDEVLACAGAGKHVLCDKPLALTLDDTAAMIAACDRAGVVFATNHHLRNAATHIAIRQAVSSGRIGRPVVARVAHGSLLPKHLQTWRIAGDAGAGAALDLTVHDADLLRFLLDDEFVRVSAMTANSGMAGGTTEDTVVTTLMSARGTIGQFQDVFNAPYSEGRVEIHGTEGSIIGRNVMSQAPAGSVTIVDADGVHELSIDHENLYVRGIRRFVAAIAGTDVVPSSGLDGSRSLAIALAALESSRTGRAVEIAAQ